MLKSLQLVAATKANEPSLIPQQHVKVSGYQPRFRNAVRPEIYPDNVQHFSAYRNRTQPNSITRPYAEILAVSCENHKIYIQIHILHASVQFITVTAYGISYIVPGAIKMLNVGKIS